MGAEVKQRDEESSERGLESDDLGRTHTHTQTKTDSKSVVCVCVHVGTQN